jgi:hypothetical protein
MTFPEGGHCGAFVDDEDFSRKGVMIFFRSLKMRLAPGNIPACSSISNDEIKDPQVVRTHGCRGSKQETKSFEQGWSSG